MSAALRPLNDPQRMKAIFLDVPLRHQEAVPNRTFTHQDGQHSFRARENAFGTREHLIRRWSKMEGASPVGRMGVFRL